MICCGCLNLRISSLAVAGASLLCGLLVMPGVADAGSKPRPATGVSGEQVELHLDFGQIRENGEATHQAGAGVVFGQGQLVGLLEIRTDTGNPSRTRLSPGFAWHPRPNLELTAGVPLNLSSRNVTADAAIKLSTELSVFHR